MRPLSLSAAERRAQDGTHTLRVLNPMLHGDPISNSTATVSDSELGIAVVLLGLALLVAAVLVPIIG